MSLSVSFLDVLIVLIIIVSAGYACWRGFLWETLTVFAWVAAAFGCLYFGPYIEPMTRSMVSEGWLSQLLAYAAVFLVVFIPLAFMSHRFSQSVKNSPIGPLDRAAGVAFGVVRGLVIVGLAYLAFTYFVPIRQQPRWLTEAELLPMVQSTSEVLLSVLPEHTGGDHFVPQHEIVRQAPSPVESTHDPMADLIRGESPAKTAEKSPEKSKEKANSVADLIRSNGEATPKSTPEPVQKKSTAAAKKSYGAGDRQALDKLIETGGNSR